MHVSDIPTNASDVVKSKLGGSLLATIHSGTDELGNPILIGDLGPVEVSVYTSQDDGAVVVQIDSPVSIDSEHPTLRVYLNDETIYNSSNEVTEASDSDEESSTNSESE